MVRPLDDASLETDFLVLSKTPNDFIDRPEIAATALASLVRNVLDDSEHSPVVARALDSVIESLTAAENQHAALFAAKEQDFAVKFAEKEQELEATRSALSESQLDLSDASSALDVLVGNANKLLLDVTDIPVKGTACSNRFVEAAAEIQGILLAYVYARNLSESELKHEIRDLKVSLKEEK